MVMLRSGSGGRARPDDLPDNSGAVAAPSNCSRRRDAPPPSLYDVMDSSSEFLSLEAPTPSTLRNRRVAGNRLAAAAAAVANGAPVVSGIATAVSVASEKRGAGVVVK